MAAISSRREVTRFLRFAVVGVIGAVVDFGTFNLLNGVFHVLPVYAQTVSFIAAVISNFNWNRRWTYPDSRSKSIHRQLFQFTVVSLIGLAIRTPIFAFLTSPLTSLAESITLRFPPLAIFPADFLGENGALAVAVLVVMMWNFFINRFWTYNDVE